jgi:hypothetical protein
MKRQWRIRRTTVRQVNGQQRWEQAYQNLLQWTCPTPDLTGQTGPASPPTQEVSHASSDLCAGVDLAASPSPDH